MLATGKERAAIRRYEKTDLIFGFGSFFLIAGGIALAGADRISWWFPGAFFLGWLVGYPVWRFGLVRCPRCRYRFGFYADMTHGGRSCPSCGVFWEDRCPECRLGFPAGATGLEQCPRCKHPLGFAPEGDRPDSSERGMYREAQRPESPVEMRLRPHPARQQLRSLIAPVAVFGGVLVVFVALAVWDQAANGELRRSSCRRLAARAPQRTPAVRAPGGAVAAETPAAEPVAPDVPAPSDMFRPVPVPPYLKPAACRALYPDALVGGLDGAAVVPAGQARPQGEVLKALGLEARRLCDLRLARANQTLRERRRVSESFDVTWLSWAEDPSPLDDPGRRIHDVRIVRR